MFTITGQYLYSQVSCKMDVYNCYHLTRFYFLVITWTSFIFTAESACTFPSYLLGQWTDVTQSATITFQSTPAKMTGWTALITGEKFEGQTCIHNTGNVFVFEGDRTVFDPFLGTLTYYMCMKITKVSDDVLYYYLLADRNGVADNERIYTANQAPDISSTPTCDYCQFTQTIPDTDRRELRKLGTSEKLTSDPSLCLPCEATCHETTTSNASVLGMSSSLTEVTTMNPSTSQTTPEASTPTISQHFTTDIITTTKVTPDSLKQTTNGAVSACTFPSYLLGQWIDVTQSATITFQSTPAKMTGWTALITGEKFEGQTCIHNTGNVFVFEGDRTVFDPFLGTLTYYMCMKITKVSDDVLYYYLLADRNGVANNERIYTANLAPDISSTPTCDYCQFTQTIPDTDRRELRKLGTSETLTSNPSLCLPCEATCDETTTSNASTLGPSSSLVTTMNPSIIQTTPEASTPTILQHLTTDIITTTKVTPDSLKQTTNGAERACTFPSYLIGQWTDMTKGVNITFQSTPAKMTGWNALVTGEKFEGQTCIHNTGNVFVFEGDDTYHIPFSDKLKYFVCMKITKVSDDVLYYYLLADINSVADNERIYTPNPAPDVSTSPTCNYCQFHSSIPDSDFRELRKLGTSETIISTPVLCLPCEATCEETSTSSPTTIVPPSSAITTTKEATTKHSSLLQTTTELSSPGKTFSHTTDIITQSTTGETSSSDIQQTSIDLSKLQTSTTADRQKEVSTTIKTTQTASVTEQKTSQTTSKFTTNIVISDTTTTDRISTYKPTTTTSDIFLTPSKVVIASKDILTTTDKSILTTQQEKLTTTAKSSGTGSIVDNKTEGLTESSILLITASSISGVLLGLAIITIALCLIRNKTNIVKGHTAQHHHHRHHRDRTRDYFNPL